MYIKYREIDDIKKLFSRKIRAIGYPKEEYYFHRYILSRKIRKIEKKKHYFHGKFLTMMS